MKHYIPLLVLSLLLLSSGAVYALDIIVSPQGEVTFFDTQVLGDTDKVQPGKSEKPNRSPEPQVLKQVISPKEGKKIEITPKEKALEVTVTDKQGRKNVLEPTNTTETKRLKMEIPVVLPLNQVKEASPAGKKIYIEQMKDDKQQRAGEKYTVQNTYDDNGEIQLEIESRNVRAKLNGAQFVYDPATNVVTLTTPSGNQHTLQHMPDQAIKRMQSLSTAPIASDAAQLEVSLTSNGDAVYKTEVTKHKRFLGLIPRQIDTEVVMNDTTGTVIETPKKQSVFDKLINLLSF